MGFRLGLVTGLATGYYLGTRAGRQRYDQINRQLTKLKQSEALDEAAERAKAAVSEGVEKARSLVESRSANRGDDAATTANGQGTDTPAGLVVAGETPVATTTTAEIIVAPAGEATAPIAPLDTDLGTDLGTGGDTATGGSYSSSR